jgi:Ca-activated chloride channel homolog
VSIWIRLLIAAITLSATAGLGAAYVLVSFATGVPQIDVARFDSLVQAEWQEPHYAYALLVVPLVFFLGTFALDRRKPMLRIGTIAPLAVGPRGFRTYLRDIPGVVRGVALTFLIGALCRPVNIVQEERSDDKGIDIMIVMDLSGSMRAILDGDSDDVPGAPKLKPGERLTRLETAKAVVRDFISRRKSDRIGVVVFGKAAYILSPPTLDYHLLSKLVSKLTLKVIDESGTAIGDALTTAVARLRRSDAQSKVVILLTDGDNNSGRVAPDKAAEKAKEYDSKVYTIQIGSEDEVEVPDGTDPFGQPRYTRQRFPVNPELLKRIADQTGGTMFTATDGKALAESMHAILDQLEKTRFEAPHSSHEELFPMLLIPGVILLGLDVLLRALLLRRFP